MIAPKPSTMKAGVCGSGSQKIINQVEVEIRVVCLRDCVWRPHVRQQLADDKEACGSGGDQRHPKIVQAILQRQLFVGGAFRSRYAERVKAVQFPQRDQEQGEQQTQPERDERLPGDPQKPGNNL